MTSTGQLPEFITIHPLIEQILASWRTEIGPVFEGYRGHVYRVLNLCCSLHKCEPDEIDKLAIAAAFHDIGLWSDQTVDYVPPSVQRAADWLALQGRTAWTDEICMIIEVHHKVRAVHDQRFPLVEVFRKADLIDFSLGLIRCGVSRGLISSLKTSIPNQGFHAYLVRTALKWFIRHPLRPIPFMRW